MWTLAARSSARLSAVNINNSTRATLLRMPLRTVVSQPTLGPESKVSITNPIKTASGTVLRINITERASQKLNEIKQTDNKPNQVLRIIVESGGCHGFQYIFGLKDASDIDATKDSVFERDGAKVVVDGTSLEILQDSSIDYTTELIGSQFKVVDSPYATSSCGCGSSFSIDPSALPK